MDNQSSEIATHHEDMIHDAAMDYYGKRLATCSSDRTIKIFDVESGNDAAETLIGHEGPVWQVAWAHPKFGTLLASCSYDTKVIIWKETNGTWSKIKEHTAHSASVNSIAWAPHEYGLILGCASSDGKISILTCKDDGTWDMTMINAHAIGCNAISWAPASVPGTLISMVGDNKTNSQKRFASAGCDNIIKIWKEDANGWNEETTLEGHQDWVRDIAWAPSIGLPNTYLASCSQDKTVIIWTQDAPTATWNKKYLLNEPFPDVVWRVSWSTSGNILAVSTGDNKVTLWKENLEGEWEIVGDVTEGNVNSPAMTQQ
jgi:protein transport protein SEC13